MAFSRMHLNGCKQSNVNHTAFEIAQKFNLQTLCLISFEKEELWGSIIGGLLILGHIGNYHYKYSYNTNYMYNYIPNWS